MPFPPPAPRQIFRQAVRYFPLPSINLAIRNEHGEFLFVKRLNNPAKGLWWVPGARLLNGETVEEAAHRVLRQELGVTGAILSISPEYSEERWPVEGFSEDDWENYDPASPCIHYLGLVALAEIDPESTIALDDQSADVRWSTALPNEHPYLRRYFEMLERAGMRLLDI